MFSRTQNMSLNKLKQGLVTELGPANLTRNLSPPADPTLNHCLPAIQTLQLGPTAD